MPMTTVFSGKEPTKLFLRPTTATRVRLVVWGRSLVLLYSPSLSAIHLCLFAELHEVLITARGLAQRWHTQITTYVRKKIRLRG